MSATRRHGPESMSQVRPSRMRALVMPGARPDEGRSVSALATRSHAALMSSPMPPPRARAYRIGGDGQPISSSGAPEAAQLSHAAAGPLAQEGAQGDAVAVADHG